MNHIYNYTIDDFKSYLLSKGEKPFRSTQLIEWLYRHKINSFDEISNMKKNIYRNIKTRLCY